MDGFHQFLPGPRVHNIGYWWIIEPGRKWFAGNNLEQTGAAGLNATLYETRIYDQKSFF